MDMMPEYVKQKEPGELEVPPFFTPGGESALNEDYETWLKHLDLKQFYPPKNAETMANMRITFAPEYSEDGQEIDLKVLCLLLDGDYKEAKRLTGLSRYDNRSFLRILGALCAVDTFRNEYGISEKNAHHLMLQLFGELHDCDGDGADLSLIWHHFNS